jgi:oligosaccharide repeat unit polymerase
MNIENQEQAPKEIFSLKIKRSTIRAFLGIVLYKVVLDLAYYFIISRVWSYAQFTLEINSLKLVESYLLLVIIFILMPKSREKLSNIMVWLLILLSYIPMLTIFAFMDEARVYMYAVTGFWLIVFLLLHMPTVYFAPLRQSKIIRYSLFICLGVVVLLLIYEYLGLSFNLDLTKVYDIRREYVAAEIPMIGYLVGVLAKIVNPTFFVLFLVKKKWVPAVLIIIFQLLLFSATGNRSYLFTLPIVLVLMWIVTRRNSFVYIGIGLAAVVFLGMLSYWLINDLNTISLLARRTLLVPAQISFFYYDFFSSHELVLLSNSSLGFFIDYPYHLNPPHLIAETYFNQPEMGANTGIWGDAYMNFGLLGLALWGILLAIILKLVDSCSRRVDLRIGVAVIAMVVINLTNSGLLTNILTHGLWLALLLLYLLPKRDVIKEGITSV